MSLDALGTENLAMILRNGGSVKVSSALGTENLALLARNIGNEHTRLIVTKAAALGTQNLAMIARNGDGKVIFE